MIRINLLPHREQKRQAKVQRFAAFLGIFACAGLVMVMVAYFYLQERIQIQNDRNAYLTDQIKVLDAQLEDITKLKRDLDALSKKKDVVQRLQSNRSEAVNIMLALVKATPTGIYLKEVKQTGTSLLLTGVSQSNARVATYMRALEDFAVFSKPVVLKNVTSEQNVQAHGPLPDLHLFNLTVNIAREVTDDSKSKKHAADKKG